jgi:hypothetical protein
MSGPLIHSQWAYGRKVLADKDFASMLGRGKSVMGPGLERKFVAIILCD